jgi:chorismate synthase
MNSFGRIFRVSFFGESHGPAVGVVLDGVTPGLELSEADFREDILRRKSGAAGTTPRIEADFPEILSGVFGGKTTGAPLSLVFRNTNTRSGDYDLFKDVPRPGHADYVGEVKFHGFNDPRGGGHFSGRLTLPMVAAGVVAKKMLAASLPDFSAAASLVEMGGCQDPALWEGMTADAARSGDSLGGIVSCRVEGLPVGLGEPFWDSVESLVAHAVFAIPGVRGVEFGDGFRSASMAGSEHNDPIGPGGKPIKNGAGGVNGGLTNGAPLEFRVAFKPTSSIRKEQSTWNFAKNSPDSLSVPGRHDTCIAIRGAVVVESVASIVLADLLKLFDS